MRLTAVDIVGFKSFSEPTRIEFHEGVTAIVGPNGSGKSNITDAIRWVLGEQSTNELRAGRMVDVVFSGTQSKRALGFAEVTIYFDNQDGGLPIEFSDVAVTRRYYRSGESEYEINGAACRLKDIIALFMDTGIGKDGYSIIGQGKVDQILSPKGDERRQIFDEASGIVKFKTRKAESLKKLEQTDLNLVRLDDILGELSLRLGPLEKQADDARAFLAHSEALKTLEIWYVDNQVKNHLETEHQLNDELFTVKTKQKQAETRQAEIREAYESIGQTLALLENETESLRAEHDRLGTERSEVLAEKSRAELSLEHGQSRVDTLEQDIRALGSLLATSDGDDEKQKKKRESLERLLARYEAELEEKRNALEKALNEAQEAASKRRALADELDQLRQKRFEAKSELVEIGAEIQTRQRQLEESDALIAENKGDLSRLSFQLEEWKETHQKLCTDAELAATRFTEHMAALEAKSQTLQEAERELVTLSAEIKNIDYRSRLLTDLERQGEGYPGVVRRIEKKRREDSGFRDGVRGPLAGLLEVDDGFALAVETALGAAANHIVTENQQIASRWIAWLKETKGGRATFLPIAQMKAWPLDPKVIVKATGKKGFLGSADQFVRAADDLDEIIGRLLGRTLVVDTLDHALTVFNAVDRMVRIVTLDGELLSPGGSISGGHDERTGAGVISRKSELRQLTKKRAEIRLKEEAIETSIASLRPAIAALENERAMLDQARLEAIKKVDELQHTLDEADKTKKALEKANAETESRQSVLRAELATLRGTEQMVKQTVETVDHKETLLTERLSEDPVDDKTRAAVLDALRADVGDLRVNVTSVEETLRSHDALDEQMRKSREADRARLSEMERQIETARKTIEETKARLLSLNERSDKLAEALHLKQTDVRQKSVERQALESKRHEAFSKMETEGEAKGALLAEEEKLEAKRERLQNTIDELKNRLWERYELVQDELKEEDIPDLPGMTPAKASREMGALRTQIRDIGPVNPAAIEELSEVGRRVESLHVQREDMEQARQELETVIADLDRAMKEQFSDGFAKINAAFTQVFRELFNGGDATLELADQDNLLESDIVIRAQPPGKRMQNLNPLSGGERSLTAIALLFAIMRLRPAPFCVFDEIESNLDDANVLRFADYIRKYATETQFVLVTHRKGTMESADRLYGVTMQERGISSILSMQLETSARTH